MSQGGTGGQAISNFVPKSNHVSFETDRLSKFAVVGKLNKHSFSAIKRMKVAAFCNETNVEEDLVVVYCFDDCEYSFEKIGNNSLRNSFDIIPFCELVFHPTAERKTTVTTFFALMTVTHEPFFQTMVYASTALKRGDIGDTLRTNENIRTRGGNKCEILHFDCY
ncbi:uncharacterized protein [Montipora foliosa]|uniref:uncharacterized protein isoform X2 n=1 Tax=Montipora foliosa TaxID=591990 RepID=UPI0035F20CC2